MILLVITVTSGTASSRPSCTITKVSAGVRHHTQIASPSRCREILRSDGVRSERSRISGAGARSRLDHSSSTLISSFPFLLQHSNGFSQMGRMHEQLSARAFLAGCINSTAAVSGCSLSYCFLAKRSPIPSSRKTHHFRLRWLLVTGGGVGRLLGMLALLSIRSRHGIA